MRRNGAGYSLPTHQRLHMSESTWTSCLLLGMSIFICCSRSLIAARVELADNVERILAALVTKSASSSFLPSSLPLSLCFFLLLFVSSFRPASFQSTEKGCAHTDGPTDLDGYGCRVLYLLHIPATI